MRLPKPRGPLGEAVLDGLRVAPHDLATVTTTTACADADPEDAALVLWALHELEYRGFEDVDPRAEGLPGVVAVRRTLEDDLEARLRARWAEEPDPDPHLPVAEAVFAMVEADDAPSVARHVQTEADLEQVRDLLRMRSVYHLKESDPVAWIVPRLPVVAKAALAELQYDEYGGGDPGRLHHHLFALGLEAAGLRSEYGAYVDEAPLEVLEQSNAVSLFGLARRLRGAGVGHLAAFEATSSVPSRRMAQGLERVGLDGPMVEYYREHVEADAVHEQLAARSICGELVRAEPDQRDAVLLGAFTCLDLERRFAEATLARWGAAS